MSRICSPLTTDANGYLVPTTPIDPSTAEQITVNGWRAFESKAEDRVWDNTKHEMWLMPNSRGLKYLGTGAYNQVGHALNDPRIKGIVYTANWKDLEPTLNGYTMTSIDSAATTGVNSLLYALDLAHSLGKKLVLRIWWKSYTGYSATPNTATVSVPPYLLNDSQYGGSTAGAYGVKVVYVGTTASGWGAAINRTAVFNRITALFDAIANSVVVGTHALLGTNGKIGMHPAFSGFCFDESTFGWVSNNTEPDDLTFTDFKTINRNLYTAQLNAWATVNTARQAAGLPKVDQIAVFNYLDTVGSLAQAITDTVVEHDYITDTIGMTPGWSDVDRDDMKAYLGQPAFYKTMNDLLPANSTVKGLVHIDGRTATNGGNATFATDNTSYQLLNVQEALRIAGGRPCRIAVVCEGYNTGSWLALESAMTTLGVA
jgi:hypothetical protein